MKKLYDASKEGYEFAGWYNDPEGKNRIYEMPGNSIGGRVIYAKYKKKGLFGLFGDGNAAGRSPKTGEPVRLSFYYVTVVTIGAGMQLISKRRRKTKKEMNEN